MRRGAHRQKWSAGTRASRPRQRPCATKKARTQNQEELCVEVEESSRPLRNDGRGYAGIRCLQSGRGEKNREVGAALDAVPASDVAIMLANNAVACAQSEARSLPDRFGCIKGFECVFRMPETRTGIRELNAQLRFAGTYGDRKLTPANLFQRVHRIRNDLKKNVKQLAGIGQHRRACRLRLQVNAQIAQLVEAA